MRAVNEKQTKVYEARLAKALELLRKGPMTNTQLSKRMVIGRCVATKYTATLYERGLITYEAMPLPIGGRVKVYSAKPGAEYLPPRASSQDFVMPDAFMWAMVAHGRENRA